MAGAEFEVCITLNWVMFNPLLGRFYHVRPSRKTTSRKNKYSVHASTKPYTKRATKIGKRWPIRMENMERGQAFFLGQNTNSRSIRALLYRVFLMADG